MLPSWQPKKSKCGTNSFILVTNTTIRQVIKDRLQIDQKYFIFLMNCFMNFRPDMEEAKEVHKCLKIAAGVFTYVKVSKYVLHVLCR